LKLGTKLGRKRREGMSHVSNVDVLFLVEHIARELDVVTCLMQKLSSRHGLTVAARNYYQDFADSITHIAPRVVVFPFFYGADHVYPIEYVRTWPTARFVNLGWEQVLNKTDLSMKIPRDDVARHQVLHVCWTHKHRDFLAEHGVPSDHLLLTGNPVMKLYERPYIDYFESRTELASSHNIDSRKKWVLFPESYQFAFFDDEHLQFLADHQNADIKFMRQAKDYSERSLRQLFTWASELRESDPFLVIRPRPSTGEEQIRDFMRRTIGSDSSNIRIVKAETVREWTLASDHVMSSHSTTLIEAALAGKPIHRFSPEAYPEALALDWHELVPLLTSRDDLLAAIRSEPVDQTGAGLRVWARTQFLWTEDPLDAIAGSLSELAVPGGGNAPPHRQHSTLSWAELTELSQGQPEDIFDAAEVATRTSRWRAVLKT
jgi:surface carbohydrate biosynthesis protein